jgi:hypothetical protein
MQVFQRVLQIGMSHQTLDQKQVGALLQVVGSKAMSECMRSVSLVDVRSAMACLLADLPHCRGTQVRTFSVGTFKEIVLRSIMQKVLSQDLLDIPDHTDPLIEGFGFFAITLKSQETRWQENQNQ